MVRVTGRSNTRKTRESHEKRKQKARYEEQKGKSNGIKKLVKQLLGHEQVTAEWGVKDG